MNTLTKLALGLIGLALFLLTLPPGWLYFRDRMREHARWMESEYNPFQRRTHVE